MSDKKDDCLFCKIAAGDIASKKIYEDDDIFVFHDINPAAAVHFLMVPKVHVDNLYDGDMAYQSMLGKLLGMSGQLAREQGCDDGFRIVINSGRVARQEVYHLHVHVMGGPLPLRAAAKPPTDS